MYIGQGQHSDFDMNNSPVLQIMICSWFIARCMLDVGSAELGVGLICGICLLD